MRPEEDVIHIFRIRRRIAYFLGFPLAIAGFAVAWFGRFGVAFDIGGALFGVGIALFIYNMRCPACGKPPGTPTVFRSTH